MTGPAVSVQASMPPDTGLRVGIARLASDGTFTVEVSGKVIDHMGFAHPGGLIDGGPVAVLRGNGSWICLGAVRSQPTQTLDVFATSSLTLTTVEQAVPGASITCTVEEDTVFHVLGTFEILVQVAAITVGVGGLQLDGVVQTGRATFASQTAVGQATVFQQWTGTLTAGTHTFQQTGLKTLNVGTLAMALTNTRMSVRLGG